MKKFILALLIVVSSLVLDCSALEVCEMSSEYKRWLELGEERFNFEEPPYCESSIMKPRRYGLSKYSLYSSNNLRYSSLELGYLSDIRDQKYTSSCWTFAANSCVETSARKEGLGNFDFSEKHMEYSLTRYPYLTSSLVNPLGINRELDSGGNSFYAASYYYRFTGPILESEMPFTEYNLPIEDNSIPNEVPSVLIGNYDINYYNQGICSDDAIKLIKDKIVKYGSVGASIYMPSSYNLYSKYINGEYYYYPDGYDTNHAVNIVGWDDSIVSTNFKNTPSRNGAWIVRNSWGEAFGNKGYFYISYDDTNVCTRISNYNDIKVNDYDNAYRANYGLANYRLGFRSGGTIYTSAKFAKKTENIEYLDRVSVEVEKNTSYEVYLSKTNNIESNDDWILLGTGDSRSSGVKTLTFDAQEITNDYRIIVKYTSSEDYFFPVLCKSDGDVYKYANMPLKTTMYSIDGTEWKDLGEYSSSSSSIEGCSNVIFAYTRNAKQQVETPDIEIKSIIGNKDIIYVNTNDYYSVNFELKNIDDIDKVTHKVIDSNNKDVSEYFTLSDTIDSGLVTIKLNNSVKAGKYKYIIKYENIEKSIEFSIYNVIESTKYKIDNRVIIINLNNTKSINKTMLQSDINTNGVTYKIFNKDNQDIKDTDNIGTNYSLKIGEYTYKFIILGDVYSDGIISAFDYVKIRNHMMNNKITDANELIAADVNKDSKISALDYIAIKKIIMEGYYNESI